MDLDSLRLLLLKVTRPAVARLDLGSPAVNEQFDTPNFVGVALSIHSAIYGKICPGDVRGLRTGDKRHHRRDLIHKPVTIERCGGLLRHRPITRGRILKTVFSRPTGSVVCVIVSS